MWTIRRDRSAGKGVWNTQCRFRCSHCGLDDNADKNGATTTGKRALGKFSKPRSDTGAVLARPEPQVVVEFENSRDSVSLSLSEGTLRL